MNQSAKTTFSADLSPQNERNRRAAKEHGLRWDARKNYYVDAEGALNVTGLVKLYKLRRPPLGGLLLAVWDDVGTQIVSLLELL